MVFKSSYGDLEFPQSNILSYLTDPKNDRDVDGDEPIWYDSKDPENKNLSKNGLFGWIRRLGYGLERLGLKQGDVGLICTPNHIFVPVAYLGIVGSGFVFSGANPIYTVAELVHQLSNTSCKVVLAHPSVLDKVAEAASQVGLPKSHIFQFSDTEVPTRNGIQDWRKLVGTPEQGSGWKWPEFSKKESLTKIATINYSSGTTGLPKGVCISHSNLIANVEQGLAVQEMGRGDGSTPYPKERWIGFMPLYHAYGQLYTILLACHQGHKTWIMSEFKFPEFLGLISKHKITQLQIAPPVAVMLVKSPETQKYDISSVADVLCGAAPLSREMQNECRTRLGLVIRQGWGMTELTCGGLTTPRGIIDETGSVGRLMPSIECKLVDEDGKEVGVDQPGELIIRGPNVCLGYWRNEKATRETLDADGWLKTGDVAQCNKEGNFWIVDRKKELIKVNGFQVAPAEMEATLLENTDVADAAVVGITLDEAEWPRAYVVIQPESKGKVTPQDIQDWIASRVAKFKRLVGGVVFIDEVPKLASGKIQRKVMRDWAKRDAAEMQRTASKARL